MVRTLTVLGRLRSLPPSGVARGLAVLVGEQGPEAVTESVKASAHLAQLVKQSHGLLSLHGQRAGLKHGDRPAQLLDLLPGEVWPAGRSHEHMFASASGLGQADPCSQDKAVQDESLMRQGCSGTLSQGT